MSKIVILRTKLAAPQIVNDLLQEVAVQNPTLASWIEQFDPFPVIKECVANALDQLYSMPGISSGGRILDHGGRAYVGEVDGILQTDQLSNGLGIVVRASGQIEFIADEYRTEWKTEIRRLHSLFQDAFLVQITSSILQILGYGVSIQVAPIGHCGFAYSVEGVKE